MKSGAPGEILSREGSTREKISPSRSGSEGRTKVEPKPFRASAPSENIVLKGKMVRPERFELPTLCFEGRCSIQLSYGRANGFCNLTTESDSKNADLLERNFPYFAYFGAHR